MYDANRRGNDFSTTVLRSRVCSLKVVRSEVDWDWRRMSSVKSSSAPVENILERRVWREGERDVSAMLLVHSAQLRR